MPRLFTGIEIPTEVASALAILRGGISGARWIDPENYHLTLRFMGDIEDRVADEATALLAQVRRPTFDLSIVGLRAFGGKRPRAIVAEPVASPALADLAAEHERACRRAGLAPETRKFSPHVTLARLRDVRPQAVADYLALRGGFRAGPFPVDRVVLFSSRTSLGGGPYLVEDTFPLADA